MPRQAVSGFTLVELLVAIIVLELGVVGLVSAYAGSGRMLAEAARSAHAAAIGVARLEQLRQDAAHSTPPCAALASGTAAHVGGITESWRPIRDARSAEIEVVVVYPARRRPMTDTLAATVACL